MMRIERSVFLAMAGAMACREPRPEAPLAAPPIEAGAASETPWGPSRASEDTAAPQAAGDAATWQAMCEGLTAPGPDCESFFMTPSICKALAVVLDPERGADIMDCIAAGNRSELMCAFGITTCLEDVPEPEPDSVGPEVRAACLTRLEHCASLFSSAGMSCEKAFAIVRPTLRPELAACLKEQCHPEACLYGYSGIAR